MSETKYIVTVGEPKTIEAYLPSNYKIVQTVIRPDYKSYILIAGKDNAGWTREDYVIPRLESGLHFCTSYDDEFTAREAVCAGMN